MCFSLNNYSILFFLISTLTQAASTPSMRSNLPRRVQSGAAQVARASSLSATRPPFICASCCSRASACGTGATKPIASRSFSSSTIFKQHTTRRESIAPQTHFDFFPAAFPDGPPPKTPFTPDLKQLRKEFLQLQAKAHPDLVPANQKQQAEALSARINEAYKTLQDPLRRAQYLLSLNGIDIEDESAKLSDNSLLMEVMEAREAVEEVEKEEDLVSIRAENNDRIAESVRTLEETFANGDLEQAAQEAIRLRYWMNIEESIHGWTKESGGGIITSH
ncbi:Hypothetical protein R9X50_00167300 [Acrodontium crateriforme]|uniref:J domain-containing protein n=1 Tax=Acrodontium crateriforme TaxID=150365 RepID=A0AAQ3R8E1_9PEZI|nr:Hypothetical protein R9X50_00167300 [Acrodontium crateriforme]